MMRFRFAVTCCLPVLLTACATGALRNDETFSRATSITLHVRNECSDIVHVYFVSDAGWRTRVATVGPMQSGLFSARLASDRPGRFITTRVGEQPTPLIGHADPQQIGSRVVQLTVGSTAEFDRWVLRG